MKPNGKKNYEEFFDTYEGKTAKYFEEEHKRKSGTNKQIGMRVSWAIQNSNKIPYPNHKFAWVAVRLLQIKPNTLSTKISGVRAFNEFELLALKDFFGEDVLDVINFDIDENGKLVRIEGEE